MKKTIFLLILFTLLLVPCAAQTKQTSEYSASKANANLCVNLQETEAEKFYSQGRQFLKEHKLLETANAFEQGIKLKETTCALITLCYVYVELGRLEESNEMAKRAVASARKQIALAPDSAVEYNLYGKALLYLKQYNEALIALQKAIELDPEHNTSQSNLSWAYYGLGRFQEAENAGREAVKLFPKDIWGYNNLACALMEQGRNEEAVPVLLKALEIDPKEKSLNLNLASSYYRIERFSEAAMAYQTIHEIYPDDVTILPWLVNSFNFNGEYQKSIDIYIALAKLKPTDIELQNNLGLTYAKLGQFTEAANTFQIAVNLNPKDIVSLRNLGKALSLSGQHQQALKVFKQIEESDHYGFETYYILGMGYASAKRFDKSIEWYKNALLLNWNDVPALYGLALSYLALGDKENAEKEYKIIKQFDEKTAEQLLREIKEKR